MSKIYKTAKGKSVNLDSLIAKNEKTRAVGNMNVNARGDKLDRNNKGSESRTSRVKRQYETQVSNVQDAPVYTSKKDAQEKTAAAEPETIEGLDTAEVVDDQVTEEPTATQKGGLAAAIAKTRNKD